MNMNEDTKNEGQINMECAVRVAVRIRPQIAREIIDLCRICTTSQPNEPQIQLGADKVFTFDHVFDINISQNHIYDVCVKRLVDGSLQGYNATVLAYGQTGSGKTYTMGTIFDHECNVNHKGIIPRAVEDIFNRIIENQDHNDDGLSINTSFSVAAQFIELYNEEIIDLLNPYNRNAAYKIHEDSNGQISVSGVSIKRIHKPEDALKYLQQGALARTTAATKMNEQSSRSHAMFTIILHRRRRIFPNNNNNNISCEEIETLSSKFNFVDLAGSERLKRTGATGERAKESISINCGLLSLGNVISALGDTSKKATHIPYRDSKLTRLLQDSIGGNSQTLMIACVSPCDRDFMETLNTLKYANRARNIKNKVQPNQNASSRTISQLRREIAALQVELLEYRQGKLVVDVDGNYSISDTCHENLLLLADNRQLHQRLKAMQETITYLTEKNSQLLVEKDIHKWHSEVNSDKSDEIIFIAGYINEIEALKAKLVESETMAKQLNMRHINKVSEINKSTDLLDVVNIAKRDVALRQQIVSRAELESDYINLDETDDSETLSDSDENSVKIKSDISDIMSDIEIKSKLIGQLELSQHRLQKMRQHYEEKLNVLSSKIKSTQRERDEILLKLGLTNDASSNEKARHINERYHHKINDLQSQICKYQKAQREHKRQQLDMQAQEVKLKNLKAELTELKAFKNRLIRNMKEQANRHSNSEKLKTREIAQLQKEQRRTLHTMQSLKAQIQDKDQILKRKIQEVSVLQRNKNMMFKQDKESKKSMKSTYAAPHWDEINRSINRLASNKQISTQLEEELQRLINVREDLRQNLVSINNSRLPADSSEIDSEIDNIESHLKYIQENIEHIHQAILDRDFKMGNDAAMDKMICLIKSITHFDEALVLIEQLCHQAINTSCELYFKQNKISEQQSLLNKNDEECAIHQQLLQYFFTQENAMDTTNLLNSIMNGSNLYMSQRGSITSLKSNETYDITGNDDGFPSTYTDLHQHSTHMSNQNRKIREKTSQTLDLLFGNDTNE